MKDLSSRRRDILVGVVILLVAALAFWYFKLRKTPVVPVTTPTIQQVEQNIEDKFKFTVPDNVEKAALSDKTGGNGSGIATRNEVLADLDDPATGYFYQAWLEDAQGKLVSLGQMRVAKGGFLIEYNGANYVGYNKVVISLEKVFDLKIEKRILEGSF